jgi:hypothetical protein
MGTSVPQSQGGPVNPIDFALHSKATRSSYEIEPGILWKTSGMDIEELQHGLDLAHPRWGSLRVRLCFNLPGS